MANEYVVPAAAANLAGVDMDFITPALREWVRGRIDLELNRDFQSNTEITIDNPEIQTYFL